MDRADIRRGHEEVPLGEQRRHEPLGEVVLERARAGPELSDVSPALDRRS